MRTKRAYQAIPPARLRWRAGVLGLASIVASCTRDPSVDGPVGPGVVASAVDRQLVWAVRGPAGFGEPTVGADLVYFLARDHSLRAIDKAGGTVRWSLQLPIDASLFPGYSSLLLPGQLIVADQDVFSVDPATGAIQWRFRAAVGRRPGGDAPVAWNGTLYTGSGTGHLFALDQGTGALRWVQSVADTSDSVFRPVLSNGVVYAGVSRYPPGLAQIGSRVVALDAVTGSVRWARDLPLLAPRPSNGTRVLTLAGSLVIAASGDGIIHALDLASGETRWTAPRAQPPRGSGLTTPPDVDSRGLASDGVRIYASSGTGAIVALSPADGTQLWPSPEKLNAVFDLRTDGQSVYAVQFFGPLGVLDAATGAVRWAYDGTRFAAVPGERFTGTAAFDSANFYVNGGSGYYAFRKK